MIDGLPKPDWQRGDVSLYCGDCLEILPKLPDGCVDSVFQNGLTATCGDCLEILPKLPDGCVDSVFQNGLTATCGDWDALG